MKKSDEKTNVMRLFDAKKLPYIAHLYTHTDAVSGTEVAAVLGEDPRRVFKTLVTVAPSGKNYVFMIPVEKELDLKAAARAVKEKSVAMIKAKELLPLTGYVHGGCSPLGMKKPFFTVIDQSASRFDTFFFSAGKIGYQIEASLSTLEKLLRFTLADITNEKRCADEEV